MQLKYFFPKYSRTNNNVFLEKPFYATRHNVQSTSHMYESPAAPAKVSDKNCFQNQKSTTLQEETGALSRELSSIKCTFFTDTIFSCIGYRSHTVWP